MSPATSRPRRRATITDASARIALTRLRDAIDAELSRRRAAADLEPTGEPPVPVRELSSITSDLGGLLELGRRGLGRISRLGAGDAVTALRRGADGLAMVERLRRRTGEGEPTTDAFGFDREWTEAMLLPLFQALFAEWWRVQVRGIENVPAEGAALLVSNHAGVLPYDGTMIRMAIFEKMDPPRHARALVMNRAFSMPFVGDLMRRTGNTPAHPDDTRQLLTSGELVLVFPEGVKGTGKRYADRYRLRRFGRGGFVEAAIRAGVPIIPVSVVGSEEIHPLIGDMRFLSRLANLPYFPVTATFPWLGPLGMIPLPSSWIIEFHQPIHTDHLEADAADDPGQLLGISDQVRNAIQDGLYANLQRRQRVFAVS